MPPQLSSIFPHLAVFHLVREPHNPCINSYLGQVSSLLPRAYAKQSFMVTPVKYYVHYSKRAIHVWKGSG